MAVSVRWSCPPQGSPGDNPSLQLSGAGRSAEGRGPSGDDTKSMDLRVGKCMSDVRATRAGLVGRANSEPEGAADLSDKVADERDVSVQLLQTFADVADHREHIATAQQMDHPVQQRLFQLKLWKSRAREAGQSCNSPSPGKP